ncbi:MAG: hypothetical protein AAFX08_07550 [Pseudomonadota bacterium]
MCAKPIRIRLFAIAALAVSPAAAETPAAGGVALADARDGVTDAAFVVAPPNYRYVVAREPGSFVDCGAGAEAKATDESGRGVAGLACAVTLTETIVIPAASRSARVIIHY